jgi:hypothetical protein
MIAGSQGELQPTPEDLNIGPGGLWSGSRPSRTSEEHSLTAEDQPYILMQTGLYLTATRGMAAPETKVFYERVESLGHSLNRPLLPYFGLVGQWRYSILRIGWL